MFYNYRLESLNKFLFEDSLATSFVPVSKELKRPQFLIRTRFNVILADTAAVPYSLIENFFFFYRNFMDLSGGRKPLVLKSVFYRVNGVFIKKKKKNLSFSYVLQSTLTTYDFISYALPLLVSIEGVASVIRRWRRGRLRLGVRKFKILVNSVFIYPSYMSGRSPVLGPAEKLQILLLRPSNIYSYYLWRSLLVFIKQR